VPFIVPQGISGIHDVAICWDFNGDAAGATLNTATTSSRRFSAPALRPRDGHGADSRLSSGGGGSGTASLTGIPVNPDQDQYLQIILDRAGSDPVLVGRTSFLLMTAVLTRPSSFPSTRLPAPTADAAGTGATAGRGTFDIQVTRPVVYSSCGYGSLLEYDAANVTFTPTDPGPDDDFTAHISNVIPDLFSNQYTEFLWNWDHVPDDSLVTNGMGHIPADSSSGDVNGWIRRRHSRETC